MEVRARPKDVNIVQNVYQNAVAGEYHGLAGRTRRQDQDTHMSLTAWLVFGGNRGAEGGGQDGEGQAVQA